MTAEFQRIARRGKKAFLSDQCKEIEENNRMGKTRDLFQKIRDTKKTFHASSVQFSCSVVSNSLVYVLPKRAQCPTLWDPMDCSTPGLPVHHQLLEFTRTHVHRVSDAIQHLILCRPLLLLPSIFPSTRVSSSESVLRIR